MSRPPVERRSRQDLRARLPTWSIFLGGISLAAALVIATLAMPEAETFFDRFYNLKLHRTWDLELLQYLPFPLLLALVCSIGGLTVGRKRQGRKSDHSRVGLSVMLGLSILGLIQYLLLMSSHS